MGPFQPRVAAGSGRGPVTARVARARSFALAPVLVAPAIAVTAPATTVTATAATVATATTATPVATTATVATATTTATMATATAATPVATAATPMAAAMVIAGDCRNDHRHDNLPLVPKKVGIHEQGLTGQNKSGRHRLMSISALKAGTAIADKAVISKTLFISGS